MTPGEGADELWCGWWGYHSENGRAKTGYYGGSTPVLSLLPQARSSATVVEKPADGPDAFLLSVLDVLPNPWNIHDWVIARQAARRRSIGLYSCDESYMGV